MMCNVPLIDSYNKIDSTSSKRTFENELIDSELSTTVSHLLTTACKNQMASLDHLAKNTSNKGVVLSGALSNAINEVLVTHDQSTPNAVSKDMANSGALPTALDEVPSVTADQSSTNASPKEVVNCNALSTFDEVPVTPE